MCDIVVSIFADFLLSMFFVVQLNGCSNKCKLYQTFGRIERLTLTHTTVDLIMINHIISSNDDVYHYKNDVFMIHNKKDNILYIMPGLFKLNKNCFNLVINDFDIINFIKTNNLSINFDFLNEDQINLFIFLST